MCLQIIYIEYIYMYKQDLALNNLQWLICHKTQPNQTKPNHLFNIYIYKEDLTLNNLQWLICHKTQPINQIVCVMSRTAHRLENLYSIEEMDLPDPTEIFGFITIDHTNNVLNLKKKKIVHCLRQMISEVMDKLNSEL